MKSNSQFQSVLESYEERIDEEHILMNSMPLEEGMKRRDEFLLAVGEDVGRFMNSLVKSAKSKTILEIGTSYGYSTLWLAEAAKKNGGMVITIENDENKVAYAKNKLNKAGLLDVVDFKIGDALDILETLNEKFDFVLIDIWKKLYVPCFEIFKMNLKNHAWILADNMIFPPNSKKETEAYQNKVRNQPQFHSILLPLGSGIELSQYHSV